MGVKPDFPLATVDVYGLRSSVRVEAVIDTGFDGDLCLPAWIAEPLGLILEQQTVLTLADGQRKLQFEFGGEVEFLGVRRPVTIFVFDRDYALIGNTLMADCQLFIDYQNRKVNLFRTEPKKKKR